MAGANVGSPTLGVSLLSELIWYHLAYRKFSSYAVERKVKICMFSVRCIARWQADNESREATQKITLLYHLALSLFACHCDVSVHSPALPALLEGTYAVEAQTSLAPLSWFHGSHVTTAHAHQCCIFQSYAKTVPSRMKIDYAWASIHDNGHVITACDVWLQQRIATWSTTNWSTNHFV